MLLLILHVSLELKVDTDHERDVLFERADDRQKSRTRLEAALGSYLRIDSI